MKTNHGSATHAFEGAVGASETARLLRLGMTEPSRPVDELIARLRRPDGGEWLERSLAASPVCRLGPAKTVLIDAGLTLEQFIGIKEDSKRLLSGARDADTRLRAMLGYFFAVAGALIHARRRICSKGRDELDPILLDLAEVAPEPWSGWLASAGLVREEGPSV